MTLAELRRLAEEVVARNEHGGFIVPARAVLRLLAVAEAAKELDDSAIEQPILTLGRRQAKAIRRLSETLDALEAEG